MSETFEEWFKEDGNGDFNYFSRDYYAGQWAPLIKHTWNHQQKKIDELEKAQAQHIEYVNGLHEKIRELRGMLTESVCKECKCKQNTEVNMELVKEILT